MRRAGTARLAAWLKARRCLNSTDVATAAVAAARAQATTLPAQSVGADLVATLDARIREIDEDPAGIDTRIHALVARDDTAQFLLTVAGFGVVLVGAFPARPAAAWTPSTDSPAWQAWHPCHAIQGRSAATCTGPAASTADCCVPATSPSCPA